MSRHDLTGRRQARVDALLAQMTVEEKVGQLHTAVRNANKTPGAFGVEREVLESSGMFGAVTLKEYR